MSMIESRSETFQSMVDPAGDLVGRYPTVCSSSPRKWCHLFDPDQFTPRKHHLLWTQRSEVAEENQTYEKNQPVSNSNCECRISVRRCCASKGTQRRKRQQF